MDGLVQIGVEWITAIQSMGGWLEVPMRFFTFLGTQDFFFLVLPLIYWSIDSVLGVRVAIILITSAAVNFYAKLWFAGPRPYWVSDRVVPYSAELSFGIPSGHAQNAVAVWGIIASGIRKSWAWVAAFTLAFLIGFSRLYLGVHFVHDVVGGWLIGFAILWVFLRFWDSTAAWLKTKTFTQHAMIGFAVSLVMILVGFLSAQRLSEFVLPQIWADNALRVGDLPDPVSMEDSITFAGTFFGIALGLAWITSKGGYQASGSVAQRALRFVIGLIGVLILWRGLGMIFPAGEDFLAYTLRYFRYSLVGFWIFAGAPWLFFRIKLAEAPKM